MKGRVLDRPLEQAKARLLPVPNCTNSRFCVLPDASDTINISCELNHKMPGTRRHTRWRKFARFTWTKIRIWPSAIFRFWYILLVIDEIYLFLPIPGFALDAKAGDFSNENMGAFSSVNAAVGALM